MIRYQYFVKTLFKYSCGNYAALVHIDLLTIVMNIKTLTYLVLQHLK